MNTGIFYTITNQKSVSLQCFYLQMFTGPRASDAPQVLYFRNLLGGGVPVVASSGCSVQTGRVVQI